MPSIYRNDVRYSSVGEYTPAGVIQLYGGTYAPAGWLLCDGSEVSRTDYAALYAAIGTTYGDGDGSTTFNIPNMCGRVPVGVGESAATGHTEHTLGQKSGAETHTLTIAQIPNHTHNLRYVKLSATSGTGTGNWLATTAYKWGSNEAYQDVGGTVMTTGDSASHNNMQPYLGLNYIISTGKKIQWNSGSSELPVVRGVLVNGASVVDNGIAEINDTDNTSEATLGDDEICILRRYGSVRVLSVRGDFTSRTICTLPVEDRPSTDMSTVIRYQETSSSKYQMATLFIRATGVVEVLVFTIDVYASNYKSSGTVSGEATWIVT